MRRIALHTRLRIGSEEAHEPARREVSPALVAAIREAGVQRWMGALLDVVHDYGAGGAAAGLPVVWEL